MLRALLSLGAIYANVEYGEVPTGIYKVNTIRLLFDGTGCLHNVLLHGF
jgi:hypothetical protein